MGPKNSGFEAFGGPDHYAKAPIDMPSDLEARKIAEHFFHNQEWRLLAKTGKMYDLHGTISRFHDGLRVWS